MFSGDEYRDMSNYAKDLEGGVILLSYLDPKTIIAGTVLLLVLPQRQKYWMAAYMPMMPFNMTPTSCPVICLVP